MNKNVVIKICAWLLRVRAREGERERKIERERHC